MKLFRTKALSTILVIINLTVVSWESYAQESSSSTSQSTTPSSNKSSKSKKATSQQKALSQGYSASEALLMSQVRWNFVLSQSFARGLDQFADTYFSYTSFDTSYALNSWSALSLSTAFSSIALKPDGQLFSNYDSDPRRFGLTDTSVGISIPRIWSNRSSYLNYFGSVTLPTSLTSQDATMIASTLHGITYRYRPTRSLLLFSNTGINFNFHQMDTSDVFGTQINSPFGVSLAVGASYNISNILISRISYSQYQRVDYENNIDSIQTISLAANYIFTNHTNIYASYRYRDLVITNDEMFDDDKSLISLGVSYAF